MGLKALVKKNKSVYHAALQLRKLPYPFLRGYMAACHALLGVDGKKVYFSSFGGKLYNENPKYICEELHRICPEAKIMFRLDADGMRQKDIPSYVEMLPRFSLKALRHMATARVIVKSDSLRPWMTKFADQIYMQVWHGDRGLKPILLDKVPAPKRLIDQKLLDIGVCASDVGEGLFRRGFGFKGEMLDQGYPKNDLLVANPPEIAAEVRRELNLPEGKKVLLYAPTFRNQNTGSAMAANFSLEKLQAALNARTDGDWIVLTRGHSLNTGVAADTGMDVSAYPDVSRLLLVVDLLVTDYSSIAGDFMLLGRQIVLFHADRALYTSSERQLLFDPEQSPYRIAYNEDELIELCCNPGNPAENCRLLAEFYGMHESGHASLDAAQRIRDLLG